MCPNRSHAKEGWMRRWRFTPLGLRQACINEAVLRSKNKCTQCTFVARAPFAPANGSWPRSGQCCKAPSVQRARNTPTAKPGRPKKTSA